MLKDGYVNVLGAYLPVEIDPYLDKDGNELKSIRARNVAVRTRKLLWTTFMSLAAIV